MAPAAAMLEVIRNPTSTPDVVVPSWDARIDSLLELDRSLSGHGHSQKRGRRRVGPPRPPRDA